MICANNQWKIRKKQQYIIDEPGDPRCTKAVEILLNEVFDDCPDTVQDPNAGINWEDYDNDYSYDESYQDLQTSVPVGRKTGNVQWGESEVMDIDNENISQQNSDPNMMDVSGSNQSSPDVNDSSFSKDRSKLRISRAGGGPGMNGGRSPRNGDMGTNNFVQ